MSEKPLDKVSSQLKSLQADQVLQLLNKRKSEGQIRTVEDFNFQLETLLRELTGKTISPTLKLFLAVEDEVIDTETYNFMLERVRDDLITGFNEANNIEIIQQSHKSIIRDVFLESLKRGLNELEAKLSLYTFIDEDDNGFSDSIFSTFNSVQENRTTRDADQSGELFSDPRTGDLFDITENAYVDIKGERLVSATTTNIYHIPKNVQEVSGNDFPDTELDVGGTTELLKNIIDNKNGTFWIKSYLFKNNKEYLKRQLYFDMFSSAQEINFVEIEPISDLDITLETIEYKSRETGRWNTLYSTPVYLNGFKRIFFNKISAREIRLTFKNVNSKPVEFEVQDVMAIDYVGGWTNKFSRIKTDAEIVSPFSYINTGDITPNVAQIARSLDIANNEFMEINPLLVFSVFYPNPNTYIFSGYEFIFGLDNVRFGLATYNENSVYISPFKNAGFINQIGLSTEEIRPIASNIRSTISNTSVTYDTTDDNFYFSSIEYWVIKRSYDDNDNVIKTVRVPILPFDTTRVHHERLLLVSKSTSNQTKNDLGSTIFFTNITNGDIKIYKNGYLMTYNIDWEYDSSLTVSTPGTGDPMKFVIKILNPTDGDIYTVSYNPLTSNTKGTPSTLTSYSDGTLNIVDLLGNLSIRTLDNQSLWLENEIDESIVKSDLALCIIFRNNSAYNNITAACEEFSLYLGGSFAELFEEI